MPENSEQSSTDQIQAKLNANLEAGKKVLGNEKEGNEDYIKYKQDFISNVDDFQAIKTDGLSAAETHKSSGLQQINQILSRAAEQGAKLATTEKGSKERIDTASVLDALANELRERIAPFKEAVPQIVELEKIKTDVDQAENLAKIPFQSGSIDLALLSPDYFQNVIDGLKKTGEGVEKVISLTKIPADIKGKWNKEFLDSKKIFSNIVTWQKLNDEIKKHNYNEYVSVIINVNSNKQTVKYSEKFKSADKKTQEEINTVLGQCSLNTLSLVEQITSPKAMSNYYLAINEYEAGNYEQALEHIKAFIEKDVWSNGLIDHPLYGSDKCKNLADKAKELQQLIEGKKSEDKEYLAADSALKAGDLISAKKLLKAYLTTHAGDQKATELLRRIAKVQLEELVEKFRSIPEPKVENNRNYGSADLDPLESQAHVEWARNNQRLAELMKEVEAGNVLDLTDIINSKYPDLKNDPKNLLNDAVVEENEGRAGLLKLARKYRDMGRTDLARKYFERYFATELNNKAKKEVSIDQLRVKYNSNPKFQAEVANKVEEVKTEYKNRFGDQWKVQFDKDGGEAVYRGRFENDALLAIQPEEAAKSQQNDLSSLSGSDLDAWSEYATMIGIEKRAGLIAISDEELHRLITQIAITVVITAVSAGIGSVAGAAAARGAVMLGSELGLSHGVTTAVSTGVGFLTESAAFSVSNATLNALKDGRFDLHEIGKEVSDDFLHGTAVLGAFKLAGIVGREFAAGSKIAEMAAQGSKAAKVASYAHGVATEVVTMGVVNGQITVDDLAMVAGMRIAHIPGLHERAAKLEHGTSEMLDSQLRGQEAKAASLREFSKKTGINRPEEINSARFDNDGRLIINGKTAPTEIGRDVFDNLPTPIKSRIEALDMAQSVGSHHKSNFDNASSVPKELWPDPNNPESAKNVSGWIDTQGQIHFNIDYLNNGTIQEPINLNDPYRKAPPKKIMPDGFNLEVAKSDFSIMRDGKEVKIKAGDLYVKGTNGPMSYMEYVKSEPGKILLGEMIKTKKHEVTHRILENIKNGPNGTALEQGLVQMFNNDPSLKNALSAATNSQEINFKNVQEFLCQVADGRIDNFSPYLIENLISKHLLANHSNLLGESARHDAEARAARGEDPGVFSFNNVRRLDTMLLVMERTEAFTRETANAMTLKTSLSQYNDYAEEPTSERSGVHERAPISERVVGDLKIIKTNLLSRLENIRVKELKNNSDFDNIISRFTDSLKILANQDNSISSLEIRRHKAEIQRLYIENPNLKEVFNILRTFNVFKKIESGTEPTQLGEKFRTMLLDNNKNPEQVEAILNYWGNESVVKKIMDLNDKKTLTLLAKDRTGALSSLIETVSNENSGRFWESSETNSLVYDIINSNIERPNGHIFDGRAIRGLLGMDLQELQYIKEIFPKYNATAEQKLFTAPDLAILIRLRANNLLPISLRESAERFAMLKSMAPDAFQKLLLQLSVGSEKSKTLINLLLTTDPSKLQANGNVFFISNVLVYSPNSREVMSGTLIDAQTGELSKIKLDVGNVAFNTGKTVEDVRFFDIEAIKLMSDDNVGTFAGDTQFVEDVANGKISSDLLHFANSKEARNIPDEVKLEMLHARSFSEFVKHPEFFNYLTDEVLGSHYNKSGFKEMVKDAILNGKVASYENLPIRLKSLILDPNREGRVLEMQKKMEPRFEQFNQKSPEQIQNILDDLNQENHFGIGEAMTLKILQNGKKIVLTETGLLRIEAPVDPAVQVEIKKILDDPGITINVKEALKNHAASLKLDDINRLVRGDLSEESLNLLAADKRGLISEKTLKLLIEKKISPDLSKLIHDNINDNKLVQRWIDELVNGALTPDMIQDAIKNNVSINLIGLFADYRLNGGTKLSKISELTDAIKGDPIALEIVNKLGSSNNYKWLEIIGKKSADSRIKPPNRLYVGDALGADKLGQIGIIYNALWFDGTKLVEAIVKEPKEIERDVIDGMDGGKAMRRKVRHVADGNISGIVSEAKNAMSLMQIQNDGHALEFSRVLVADPENNLIVYENVGSKSLSGVLTDQNVTEAERAHILSQSLRNTEALEPYLLNLDIKPDNYQYNPRTGDLKMIDGGSIAFIQNGRPVLLDQGFVIRSYSFDDTVGWTQAGIAGAITDISMINDPTLTTRDILVNQGSDIDNSMLYQVEFIPISSAPRSMIYGVSPEQFRGAGIKLLHSMAGNLAPSAVHDHIMAQALEPFIEANFADTPKRKQLLSIIGELRNNSQGISKHEFARMIDDIYNNNN